MKRRRAYIGNLRPRPNLAETLYNELCAPSCLPVRNYPDGDGIIIAQPKIPFGTKNGSGDGNKNKTSSAYALVEFIDVDYAIQVLNGVQFDGRTLKVSREKTQFGDSSGVRKGEKRLGGGFGSSRWASACDDDNGYKKSGIPIAKTREYRDSDANSAVDSPSTSADAQTNSNQNEHRTGLSILHNFDDENGESAVVKGVESVIVSEISKSSDEVTSAIACTAAMTLLSSVDAFGLEEELILNYSEDVNFHSSSSIHSNSNAPNSSNLDDNMSNEEYKSRCNLTLAALLAEYGKQDVHWKQQKPTRSMISNGLVDANKSNHFVGTKEEDELIDDDYHSRRKMALSDLLAEYGEQDLNWKKQQPSKLEQVNLGNYHMQNVDTYPGKKLHPIAKKNKCSNNGMLAPVGKAPIHVEIVSFGYKYGAPSHSKKGFTHSHPLPPLDVRDLDRAPANVARFNGLSHLVKRALLNPSPSKDNESRQEWDEQDVDESSRHPNETKARSAMRQRANDIADEIIKVIVEAIDEGGHGAISPLTMTISIGSEYGRHRSVVLGEHLAMILRARLRRNDGACCNDVGSVGAGSGPGKGIVRQPVSIGTRHRDVEAHHKDDEAFGEDLKREARAVEKARRRQIENFDCDDGHW